MFSKTILLISAAFLILAGENLNAGAHRGNAMLASANTQQEQDKEQEPKQSSVDEPSTERITAELIDDEISKVEKADLEEAEKGKILSLYVSARQLLTVASAKEAEAAQLKKEMDDAASERDRLNGELAALDESPATVVDLPEKETELDNEKRELEKQIEVWQQKLSLAISEPVNRRNFLANSFDALTSETSNELQETEKQLLLAAPESENPLMTRARRVELLAKNQKFQSELALLDAKRGTYEASANNFPLMEERARRELESLNLKLKSIQDAINDSRKDESQKLLDKARDDATDADEFEAELKERIEAELKERNDFTAEESELLERIKEVADSNIQLAETNVALATELQTQNSELTKFKNLRDQGRVAVQKLQSEFESMQSRVQEIGLGYDIGVMLRRDKTALMSRSEAFQTANVAEAMQQAHLRKYTWRDKRSAVSILLTRNRTDSIQPGSESSDRTELQRTLELAQQNVSQLLTSQRTILQQLEETEAELLNDLIGLRTNQSKFSEIIDKYADFLDQRILWVRSEPILGFGDYGGIRKAFSWLTSAQSWTSVKESVSHNLNSKLPSAMLIGIGLAGLMLLQPRSRRHLRSAGAIAAKRGCREFSPTVSSLLQTIVLAILWPAFGLALGWLMTATSTSKDFAWCLGRGLTIASIVMFPFNLLYSACKREGLAQCHFSWNEEFRTAIRKHAPWFMLISAPVLVLVVSIDHSDNSDFGRLGRVLTIGLLCICIAFATKILSVFRLNGNAGEQEISGFDRTVSRLRSVLFVAAIIGFALLILFATLGYFESVFKIGVSLMQTIVLLLGAVILFGFVMRFLLVRRRKLRFEQLVQQRKTAIAAAEKQAQTGISLASEALEIDLQNEAGMDITDVSRQARELTGVIFLIVITLSLMAIWQYLIPATRILDSWELWRIAVGSGVEIVTARDLLLSLVVFALTFFGVRNIPGMLELLLLQRLPLDAGARYAVASILRYILLVVGIIVALSYLKIPWSNYSWLVAAISVGLGFGLQEIVANFVSGLILLLERPVRVGDVVTIDGVTGVVSRIQMRATTVTNWDNQELVVPNKDLISGKLLNWTLSNVINRITLRVGVAYGSDVEKVREIITKIIERHPDVLHDPVPVITFEEFGDSSLNFVVRCCTTTIKRRWDLIDGVNSAINEAFEREGIEIPFPQRVVHMVRENGPASVEDQSSK